MKRIGFNADWIFYSAEYPENKLTVRLPHDAMQTEERIPNLKNGALVGFYPGGDYYYEKTLYGSTELKNKVVILDFGGIFMDSHIYLNGEEVGGHIYGYSNFYVDLSGKIKDGVDNLIKVFVHNSQTPNSRWYSGSGIYRPVHLLVGSKEHIEPDGVKIITKSHAPALLEVSVASSKAPELEVITEILWQSNVVASGRGERCTIEIPDAKLWDAEHPNLYTYKVSLLKNGKAIDTSEGQFGIRELEWNADSGLKVNGTPVKLRGVCVHHDNGMLGATEYKTAALRRIRKLKEGGFNAIRGAHDPRSREVLEACDELGMYVMEEAFDSWYENSGAYGYGMHFETEWAKDLELMVRKCYNHPSVVLYSIGNEIAETASEEGVAFGRKMVEFIHALDDSRPVTSGINLMMNVMYSRGITMGEAVGATTDGLRPDDIVDPKRVEADNKMTGSVKFNLLISLFSKFMRPMSYPKPSDKPTKGIFSVLDVAGYNYGEASYEKHHKWYPDRIMVGTETNPQRLKQRIELVRRLPYVIGDFYWTGWDYLGECGLGILDYNKSTGSFTKPYPSIVAGCGLYDITGHRDTMAYDLAIAWGIYDKPYIAVTPPQYSKEKLIKAMYRFTDGIACWTFDGYEGTKTTVRVASIGTAVELYINGKPYGRKKLKGNIAFFKVPYTPGKIEVVSFDSNGREIGRSSLETASEETVISVNCEQVSVLSGGDDIAYFEVSLTDAKGVCKPIRSRVFVTVEGPGTLLAVGSGAHRTEERYTDDSFTTHDGRLVAVVRSTDSKGDISVTFSCEGLPPKTVTIPSV